MNRDVTTVILNISDQGCVIQDRSFLSLFTAVLMLLMSSLFICIDAYPEYILDRGKVIELRNRPFILKRHIR